MIFVILLAVATVFHGRLARKPTPTSLEVDRLHAKIGWINITEDSPMMTSEAYMYVCDSTLMFGILAILIYCHPAEYVPNRKQIRQMLGEEVL
ncbi:hypothetical protein AAE478_002498 [Parahypoxylon ruwenzoriense]